MYHQILVPLDGSAAGEQALPLACDIARRANAALRLVHVHRAATASPISIEGLPVIDAELHSRAQEHERVYLQRIADALTATYGISSSCETLDGDESVAALLLAEAIRSSADLIVMTTHGWSGFARLWLGSVAESLIRLSSIPLLLLRPTEEPAALHEPPMLTEMLIPLDGSAFAEQILVPAQQLGRVLGTAYTVLHVVEPQLVLHHHDLAIAPVDLDPQDTQRLLTTAQAYLDRVAQQFAQADHPVTTQTRIGPHPAATILEAIQAQPHTLLALATHGRSGLKRLLWGSVADKLLRGTTCPMLVYRPQLNDEHSPEQREPAP
ncbi:MAG TPA: universal stress protein [Herpetosiphonaceae bacterium]